MAKRESIDQESCAVTTCQKCLLLGIKPIHLTNDNREFHELLHKRHAQILLFDFEKSQSVKPPKEDNNEANQNAQDFDVDRKRIRKNRDIQWIKDVRGKIATNRYPTRTKCVNGKLSKPELRKTVARWNSKINNRKRSRRVMRNFDDSTIRLLREGIERCSQGNPQRVNVRCQVCFLRITQTHRHSTSWFGLIDHARGHVGKPSFRCSLCSYESDTRKLMYKHRQRRHDSCTDAKWSMIERKMEREDWQELRLEMMLCLGYKPSDDATVQNGVGNTAAILSGSRSESKSGDVQKNAYAYDLNIAKFGQTLSLRNRRLCLCRKLIYQNAAANGRSICRICSEQNIRASFAYRGAYDHVLDHANLSVYTCSICSASRRNIRSIANHIISRHHKPMRNNYTNRSDEFHAEIEAWIRKCFGHVKNRD